MKDYTGRWKRALSALLAWTLILSALPALAESFSAIVTASEITVYADEALSNAVGVLKKDDVVVVKKESGSVAQVSSEGRTGYVRISGMAKVEDVAKKAVVNTDTYVYVEADKESDATKLPKNTKVYLLASKGDWARIEKDGKTGFAYVGYLTVVDENAAAPTPTATPVSFWEYYDQEKGLIILRTSQPAMVNEMSVTVYEKPSTSSKKLHTLERTENVTVLAYISNDEEKWAQIEQYGNTGYVDSRALINSVATPAPTAANASTQPAATKDAAQSNGEITFCSEVVTAKEDLKVYESASTSAKYLGMLKSGTKVTRLAYSEDGWSMVEKNGERGFVRSAGLNVQAAATPTPAATVAPTVTASTTPYVDANNGEITFCQEKVIVRADSLTVYKSASTASKKLGTVKQGENLNMEAYSEDGWALVEKNGNRGFVKLSGLNKADSAATSMPTASATATPYVDSVNGVITSCSIEAVVTKEGLAVRKSAALSAKQTGTLKYGERVTVTAYSEDGWARIEQGSKTGFTLLSGLTRADQWQPTPSPAASATPTPSMENAVPATVTVDSVNVYKGPSANSDKLGTLSKGAQVNVLMTGDNWAYIECNGNYGYCTQSALTKNSDLATATPGSGLSGNTVLFDATVVYPSAKVYQSASSDSASAAIAVGSQVNVYAYDTGSGWAYVGVGNQRGYMLIKHLNKTSYSTLASGDSGTAVQTLQKALEDMGYFDGVPGGNYSSLTQEAVKRFQAAIGMTQTGTADQTTQRILYGGYAPNSPLLSANLSNGSTGSNVERIQTRLYNLGYLSKTSSVDGDYGNTTAAAVKLFQSAAGLSVTGNADANTISRMYDNDTPKLSSGSAADASSAGNGDSGSTAGSPNGSNSEKIEYVISTAKNQLGKKYVYGTEGPSTFDCSGLTQYCFKQVGVKLKRSAQQQGYDSTYEKIASISAMRRGDIVCMDTVSDNDLSDHVGIYLGNSQMIHASSGGGEVIISSLSSGYYNRVFSWGRRILG